jgi:uncharacterized membrane protein YdjX (TVP38/TMEM64 family)
VEGRRVCSLLLLLAVVLAGAWLLGQFEPLQEWVRHLLMKTDQLGGWGFVLFVAVYAVASLLLVPELMLGTVAGLLFGPWRGALCAWLGATVGAGLAFWIGRGLAHDLVQTMLRKKQGVHGPLASPTVGDGWKYVMLARLLPGLPTSLLNYALSLTHISFRDYMIGTCLGLIPGAFLHSCAGWLAGDLMLP